jgi:hypothetical protein
MQNVDIIFIYTYYFFITCIHVVNIHYPQIDNKPILKTFKNNFDKFSVFWTCFENIMQYQKYVEPRKKEMDTILKFLW